MGTPLIPLGFKFSFTSSADFGELPCCAVLDVLNTVPYSGFIEVDITFPKNCFGSQDYCADTSIRLPGKKPTVIPAGESCIIEAIAHVNSQASDRWVVVDYQTLSPLPGGMLVTSCILSLPDNPSKKLPVVMCNESKHYIILPAKSFS